MGTTSAGPSLDRMPAKNEILPDGSGSSCGPSSPGGSRVTTGAR